MEKRWITPHVPETYKNWVGGPLPLKKEQYEARSAEAQRINGKKKKEIKQPTEALAET